MSPITAPAPTPPPRGVKGRRVFGKPGRFDPDRPFHMSTRKGGKGSLSASAPSANGSAEDGESRHASSDAERPITAHSNGTQASKETDASNFSPPQPIPDIDMAEAPLNSTADVFADERKSRSSSPAQQTSPVTRKRKRSSPSPPPARQSVEANEGDADQSEASPAEDDYDSDTVEVVRQDQLSDRQESATGEANGEETYSPGSSQSQEAAPPYDAMAGTSVDVTPLISEQPSPATSGFAEDDPDEDEATIAKPLAAALKEVADAKNVEEEEAEADHVEDEPMLDVAPAIDDADEIEEQVRTDEEGRMVVRKGRFGGRRRQQHPNINIEVAMRRQAQLKSAYRTLARAQKGILAEITTRTIDDLEANPSLHTEVVEYEGIIRELDATLARRKATIQARHELSRKQLGVTLDGERDAAFSKCRQQLEDLEETKVGELQYEALRIARNAQLEDGYETEDEDDIIPRLKHTAYHWKRGAGLDPVYDSRSRLAIETQRAARDMQQRYDFHEVLHALPENELPNKRNIFAVMDERPRTAASKNREGLESLDMLADAGTEAERIANIPIIPNVEAVGLQMLSDLAVRPSIGGDRSQSRDSLPGPGVNRGAPPPLHLQVPGGPSPIQIHMSPRTQHAMGNRFDPSQMPPPSTSRQELGVPAARSPEIRRNEHPLPSPRRENQRLDGLHAPAASEPLRSPGRPQSNEAEALQQRIASRDTILQDRLFGEPRVGKSIYPDYPAWKSGLIMPNFPPRRRAASHSDPPPAFGAQTEQNSRHEETKPGLEAYAMREESKTTTPRFDPVRPQQTFRWLDQHSQAGASNGRARETASPKSEQLSLAGTPGPQSSSTLNRDYGPSTQQKPSHGGRTASIGKFPAKTKKSERQGESRRQQRNRLKQQHQQQQENGRSESSGTSTMASVHHAGSPLPGIRAPSPWSVGPPPLPSPREHLPPGLHHHSGSYGAPVPHNLPPHPMHHHASFDYSPHHRNSFPPVLGVNYPGPPPPPHSPYYPPPSPQTQPPPPGLDHQYNRPFAPPPPPSNFPPQAQHGFGSHSRGPPIAPAGAYNTGAFRPGNAAPPPAFAQAQQQQGGGGFGSGHRRRAQSDVFPKFQPLWRPEGKY